MDLVTVLDIEGKIRYQSPSVKHLLGYEPAAMLGISQFDIVHRDDADIQPYCLSSRVRQSQYDAECR